MPGRQEYIRRLDELAVSGKNNLEGAESQSSSLQSALKRGWYWGSQKFRERILEVLGKGASVEGNQDYKSSPMMKDHGVQQTEQLIRQTCRHYQVREEDLLAVKRGSGRKPGWL